jgi:hypothetical protein
MDAAGDFVVTYYSVGQRGNVNDYGLYAQQYDAAGSPRGSNVRLSPHHVAADSNLPVPPYGGYPLYDDVAMNSRGDFISVWAATASDDYGVFGQRFVAANSAAPVITGFSTTVTWIEPGAPESIAGAATRVTDADSRNFAGGTFTVEIVSGGAPTVENSAYPQPVDRLSIRSQGTGGGQIGVVGNQILYGGVIIGEREGMEGHSPLIIHLNENATAAAIQALLKNVTFRQAGFNPSAVTREIQMALTDGDGGATRPLVTRVRVIPTNTPPVDRPGKCWHAVHRRRSANSLPCRRDRLRPRFGQLRQWQTDHSHQRQRTRRRPADYPP